MGLVAAVSALNMAMAPCEISMGLSDAWDLWRLPPVLVLALVAGAGIVFHFRHEHRAVTLLPPPVDPLASYRDGPPVECPRHPFAR